MTSLAIAALSLAWLAALLVSLRAFASARQTNRSLQGTLAAHRAWKRSP